MGRGGQRSRNQYCPTGKIRYPNEAVARDNLLRLRLTGELKKDPSRAESRYYHCRRCNGWHVTKRG